MTVVLIDGNKVYADSACRTSTGERYYGFNKVGHFKVPTYLYFNAADEKTDQVDENIRVNKGENMVDLSVYNCDDTVYGWCMSGNFQVAEEFIKMLERNQGKNTQQTILTYLLYSDAKLINAENTFVIILIGEKANHGFELKTDGFDYLEFDKQKVIGIGTGGTIARRHYMANRDPIEAMYQTIYLDDECGGELEIWDMCTLEETGKRFFGRIGICNEVARTDIPNYLKARREYKEVNQVAFKFVPYDFMHRHDVLNMVLTAAKEAAKPKKGKKK